MNHRIIRKGPQTTNWIKPAMGAVIIAGIMMGCQKSKNKEEVPAEPQTKIIDTATLKDAEELAKAGEQLLSPYSFMYANHVFERALQMDPENKRAQFYLAFLEVPMSFQGILTRIRPLATAQKQLADLDRFITDFPESPLKSFLLEVKNPATQPEINNSNIQDFYVGLRNRFNNWRKFLKKNHDLKLTLNLNPDVYKDKIAENAKNFCVPEQISEAKYKVQCDFTKIMQIEVGEADIIALQQYVSGALFYYAIPTSYDWKTLTALTKNDRYKQLSPSQLVELVHSLELFAPLRKDHALDLLEELGSDFVAALRWAMDRHTQNELCPNGKDQGARKGSLFENGMCTNTTDDQNQEVQKILTTMTEIFRGPTEVTLNTEKGMYTTLLDFSRWKNSPPKDLKIFVPTQLNSCGKPSQFLDATFGGILPQQDWYNMIETSCK